jgi:DNA-binding transcriptional ArsR family regulator
MRIDPEPDVALVARMIGEPARAAMLSALLGGQALPAGELARRARVAPATASAHLARLIDSGLIVGRRSGRHHYFALASGDVAAVMEALARVVSPQLSDASATPATRALRYARTCYDHLAGKLGVLLADSLLNRGIIAGADSCQLTALGEDWLVSLGIDVQKLRGARRAFVRPCLDWSERRDHVAGAVGAAITTALLDRRWLVRIDGSRAVRLTLRGREGLYRSLGMDIPIP